MFKYILVRTYMWNHIFLEYAFFWYSILKNMCACVLCEKEGERQRRERERERKRII
jgi:hypothetical protein